MSLKTLMIIEIVLAAVCVVLTVSALIWPTWIENLVEASPDNGSGSAERGFALIWLAGAILFGWLARRHWVRLGRTAGESI